VKVAVSAEGPDLNARAGGRFGTSAYFIIVDTQTMAFEAVENPGAAGQRAAGIQAVILAVSQKVDAVLTGFCSPTATKYLSENGIKVVTGIDGTVGDAVRQYLEQIQTLPQTHLDATGSYKNKINKDSLISALKISTKQLAYLLPVLIGVILLVGLFNTLVSKEMLSFLFSGNAMRDTLAGSFFGSLMAGNPITSYVIGGELLASGVSLFGVTAFLVAWVSVGLVQLPAEMAALGRKFALVRNGLFFILSIIISILTVTFYNIVMGSFL
jgi:predicted Fe-Mo cluster-binding NifX family protein